MSYSQDPLLSTIEGIERLTDGTLQNQCVFCNAFGTLIFTLA